MLGDEGLSESHVHSIVCLYPCNNQCCADVVGRPSKTVREKTQGTECKGFLSYC